MKILVKSYFKVVAIVFGALYFGYLIFEFTLFDKQINLLESVIKVLILALLLPLFSKKYIAAVSSEEEVKKFTKTRKKLFIGLGLATVIAVVAFFILISTSNK